MSHAADGKQDPQIRKVFVRHYTNSDQGKVS